MASLKSARSLVLCAINRRMWLTQISSNSRGGIRPVGFSLFQGLRPLHVVVSPSRLTGRQSGAWAADGSKRPTRAIHDATRCVSDESYSGRSSGTNVV
jgi:hypothetical protein